MLLLETEWALVTAIRLLVPLLILRRPLPGILLAIVADFLDYRILDLDHGTQAERDFYQPWDKTLDLYYMAIALYVSFSWQDHIARNIGIAIFSYRMVGVGVLVATGAPEVLLAFPNLFENYFVIFYLYRFFAGEELVFARYGEAFPLLLAITVPQVFREYFLHIAEDRPWLMITLVPVGGQLMHLMERGFWISLYLLPQVAALRSLLLARGVVWEWRILWAR
jgi:hypothetical protein